MPGIEEVIKMVYREYRRRHNQSTSTCPDEETLVCFCEGRLSKRKSDEIQQHLISCRPCTEAVSLFCQEFKEQVEVPEFLIKKAKGLIKELTSSNFLEVVLALKEKALQLLETTGDVILDNEIMPLPVLRSRQIDDFPEELKLVKEFRDMKVALHIQRKEKDRVQLSLTLVDKNSLKPLGDLRLALLEDGCELDSYEVTSGNVVFDKIGFGRYAIHILREENKLGIISLQIQ